MNTNVKISFIFIAAIVITPQVSFASANTNTPTISVSAGSTTSFNHPGFLAPSAGWSNAEAHGTWSTGNQALINIRFPKFNKMAVLTFTSAGFVNSKNPKITLTIFVNSKLIDSVVYTTADNLASRLINIPVGTLKSNFTKVPLVFKIAGSQSPHNLGLSLDKRNLGIYLESISLKSVN